MALTALNPSQYSSILPLFAPLDFNLMIRSVVEGNTPGWVFGDDPHAPRFAVLWDRQDGIAIAGNADPQTMQDLPALLREQIVPDARARGVPEMALLYTPEWQAALPELLYEYAPQAALRQSFRLPDEILRGAPLPQPSALEEYEILPALALLG